MGGVLHRQFFQSEYEKVEEKVGKLWDLALAVGTDRSKFEDGARLLGEGSALLDEIAMLLPASMTVPELLRLSSLLWTMARLLRCLARVTEVRQSSLSSTTETSQSTTPETSTS